MSRLSIAILGKGREAESTYWSEQGQLVILDHERRGMVYSDHFEDGAYLEPVFLRTLYTSYLKDVLIPTKI